MTTQQAKDALDHVIRAARVHLYKPIQIAEILYRDRIDRDIELSQLDTYRLPSRSWRDVICVQFLGRTSSSSARYQDDVFNDNATPPSVLVELGKENRAKNGIVEAYVYSHFANKQAQMNAALDYCTTKKPDDFSLRALMDGFWREPGLRRSIDKIYEIVVYALFETLVEELGVTVTVSRDPSKDSLLKDFDDFARKVLAIDTKSSSTTVPARFHRVGVTNAADRGLDMYSNYGPAVQIKHLSLSEELAADIVSTVTTDRIVIVCKDSEKRTIVSLLNQIGWKARIQSVVTQSDLETWYSKALRGPFAEDLAQKLLAALAQEIKTEFPSVGNSDFPQFIRDRGYDRLQDPEWRANPQEQPPSHRRSTLSRRA